MEIEKWIAEKVFRYTEPVKSGLGKGVAVGFMRPKYHAAVLLSLTAAKPRFIAAKVGTTSGTVRVWKTEPAFKKLVAELAAEYLPQYPRPEPFDIWYDTYERDGGELLLYNAYDLESAFLAGVASVHPVPNTGTFRRQK